LRLAIDPDEPMQRKREVETFEEARSVLALSAFRKSHVPQSPGSTRTVQKLDLLERSEAVRDDDAAPELEVATGDYSSFEVLDQLNRAGLDRARSKKVSKDRRMDALSRSQASERAVPLASPHASVLAPAETEKAGGSGPAHSTLGYATLAAPPSSQSFQSRSFGTQSLQSQSLQSQLDDSPMAGVVVDDDHLVLHRTVILPGRGTYQQGLILDLKLFAKWIEVQVIRGSGLSRTVQLDLRPFDSLGRSSNSSNYYVGRFIYDHRFHEPFEALGARLFLSPLPDSAGSAYIYAMGLLLILVSTVGLWAMYRRVAVAVHFAERRSNFAAAVTHELKTPLTAIRMYSEMLRDGMVPDESKRHEYYTTISSEAERLTRLINNVLEFSELERRTRKLDMQVGDVEPCLRDVVRILEPHVHSRGFLLSLELDPGLPSIRFEPDALQQILFNLIDNALKYAADAQRKEIQLGCHIRGPGVVVSVRDFGVGVIPKHAPHLFEPFYRGESELTRRTKGTGIGLALVKGLVDGMGGEISARNLAEGGFVVELRLRS
jgi:signal transduction histidine kinase